MIQAERTRTSTQSSVDITREQLKLLATSTQSFTSSKVDLILSLSLTPQKSTPRSLTGSCVAAYYDEILEDTVIATKNIYINI